MAGVTAHREVHHEAVKGQLQKLLKHVDRHVLTQRSGVSLSFQAFHRRLHDRFGALRPAFRELGVGSQPPGHLQLGAEPATHVGGVGSGNQVTHHLHQSVAAYRLDHRRGVVFGDREEQRFLVLEVMEDRPPRQPGLLLQTAYRGTLVAVSGEAGPGTGQDLPPSGVEVVLTHPGHVLIVTGRPGLCNPYVRLATLCD